MKELIKAYLVPTEDRTSILINTYINETHTESPFVSKRRMIELQGETQYDVKRLESRGYNYQHLYITVSQDIEPIKEGDWGYISIGVGGTIGKVSYDKDNNTWDLTTPDNVHYPFSDRKYMKKIIATTDPKLFTLVDCPTRGADSSVKYILPQLQQSFLKEFVDNPEGKWEVEYGLTQETKNKLISGNLIRADETDHVPKLNQDNTLNITSVEEKMYSREEMESKMRKAFIAGEDFTSWCDGADIDQTLGENAWIKENL